MADTIENLILDLLEWVGRRERTYQKTMEAWRTSCPRLPVWEDATDRGLVETEHANGRSIVRLKPSVTHFLRNGDLVPMKVCGRCASSGNAALGGGSSIAPARAGTIRGAQVRSKSSRRIAAAQYQGRSIYAEAPGPI